MTEKLETRMFSKLGSMYNFIREKAYISGQYKWADHLTMNIKSRCKNLEKH